jgi:hypothetical protein
MSRVHPAAALYYVGIIILGVYCQLNLFLAIILDSLGQVSEGSAGGDKPCQGTEEREFGQAAAHGPMDNEKEAFEIAREKGEQDLQLRKVGQSLLWYTVMYMYSDTFA